MKLYYSSASPYARKVRVVALEKNISLELVAVSVADNPPELHRENPVGKIPTLITEKGVALPESSHICVYLDAIKPTPAVFPKGDGLANVLRRDALAIGMMDALVRHVLESRRPAETQSRVWIDRQIAAINRTLDVLEKEIDGISPALSIDQISLMVALDYADFRLPQLKWKEKYARLAAWVAAFGQRQSIKETMPC